MSNITVEKMDVLAYTVTGAERLDPVRVMIENYEPGKGRITVTCYGRAWTGAWFAMGGDTVQDFIKRVSNDYLIGCLAPRLESTIDDDNEANLNFVKQQIIKLRQEREIEAYVAREMWAEAENADDVKANCCDFLVGEKLLNLFGDDPWYAGWPKVPNHEYQYLERVLNAMREGLNELERAVMSTNLKEWLQQTIAELEEERDAVPGVVNEDAVMALEAMKIALASLEAEPVCVIDQSNLDYLKSGSDADVWPASRTEMGDVLLYRAAPPAPVSVPAAMEMDDDFDSAFEHGKAVGWNAYRAAMLQGAEQQNRQQNIPENIPATQFKPVADLYGLTSPTGSETSFTFDAVEARDFIDGGWSCQEYVELERFQEAITNHTEDKLAMVDHSGDSNNMVEPVTTAYKLPEGWVACSERMPEQFVEVLVCTEDGSRYVAALNQSMNWDDGDFFDDIQYVTHWMPLPAAPQQEVKS